MKRFCWPGLMVTMVTVFLLALGQTRGRGADVLNWNTTNNQVSADISSVPLIRLLEGISQVTGWQVFLESNATRTVSVKFQNLPAGQALRNLLGDLNFALVPEADSRSRLFVFHSKRENATMLLQPGSLAESSDATNAIPNELLVTLKKGRKIGQLGCLENAKIVGRLDALNTYRIQFADEAAARVARECLENNPDVESVDSNFSVARPPSAQQMDLAATELNLKLKDRTGDCSPIIALIDTHVDPAALGKNVSDFFLSPITIVQGGNVPRNPGELTHGPAMAETILRALQTVTAGNTSARILPVDVYGNQASTTTFDVTRGVYEAINSGANIINMSLGSQGSSSVLHNLIQQGIEKGVVFFGAAGNEPVTTPTYPAAYPEVMAVTAGDRHGNIASYANRGAFVDIMAPGMSVVPFNGQAYLVNGTSAATAYASGIAAGLADASGDCPPGVLPTMRNRLGVNLGAEQ